MSRKYYYEITRGWGQNLKESIRDYERQSKWDDMVSEEHTSLVENMAPGKERRDRLVNKIMEELTEEDIEVIADIASIDKDDQTHSLFNESQETLEDRIKKWLMDNECPSEIFNEKDVEDAGWVWNDADEDVQLWYDEIADDNDFEIALFFEYLKFPSYNRETDKYEEGDGDHIPIETANKLLELYHQQSEAAKKDEERNYKNPECIKIGEEIKALKESLILVSKVKTNYDEFKLHHSVPISEIPECPCCGSCFDYTGPAPLPKTTDDAFNYLLRADSDDPMVTCPDCGNGGEEFAEVWIKSVGCPLPEEYLDKRLWKAMKLLAA